MFKDTPDGQTNYCKHENTSPIGVCDDCMGKKVEQAAVESCEDRKKLRENPLLLAERESDKLRERLGWIVKNWILKQSYYGNKEIKELDSIDIDGDCNFEDLINSMLLALKEFKKKDINKRDEEWKKAINTSALYHLDYDKASAFASDVLQILNNTK